MVTRFSGPGLRPAHFGFLVLAFSIATAGTLLPGAARADDSTNLPFQEITIGPGLKMRGPAPLTEKDLEGVPATSNILAIGSSDLAAMTPEELKGLLAGIEKRIQKADQDSAELRKQVYETHRKTRLENSDIKALQAEIEALREKIEQAIKATPEMQALANQQLLNEQELIKLGKQRIEVLRQLEAPSARTPPAAPEQERQ